jgi:hydrogenase small subunit
MACTMPGFPDKYMPFMDPDTNGSLSSNIARFTYGPVLRNARKWSIRHKFDKEPEWRHNRAELTTGYAKRW